MGRYDDDDGYYASEWYHEGAPLPAARGVKAKSQRGQIGEQWWSQRFVDALEALGHGGSRLQRGKRYARKGQVMDVTVHGGTTSAHVQGTRPAPYQVELRLQKFTPDQWATLTRELARQALYAASLLAGEMPREIEQVCTNVGLDLFPRSLHDLEMHCSCPDYAVPCKHIAAVLYILAEAFDEDPFLILAWRDRDRETLLADLRALRGDEAAAETFSGETTEEPLPEDPAEFWRSSDLSGLRYDFAERGEPDGLLRVLGPLPAEAGGNLASKRLAALYQAISTGARTLAGGEERGTP